MNFGGIFAILDDVAATMDDVAVVTKIAAKKTAGILGDDLAVNANLSSQFASNRELPVLLAIAKGSFFNKLIILPIAFLLSAYIPWIIVPILILGAFYLGFEGAEKVEEWIHNFLHKSVNFKSEQTQALASHQHDLADSTEQEKIKKAIRTDFILSIEIIVIALGTVANQSLMIQIIVVSLIAMLATVGVYGLVAMLVRMDDFGYKLYLHGEKLGKPRLQNFGMFLIELMPKMIKTLAVVGVIAMLLVSGGIFVHNIDLLHRVSLLNNILSEFFIGLLAGFVIILMLKINKKLFRRS